MSALLADRLQDLIDLVRTGGGKPESLKLLVEVHEELTRVAVKVRTMTVQHDLSAQTYRVVKVTDSVDYRPGEFLETDVVRVLCDDAAWKVTVVLEK